MYLDVLRRAVSLPFSLCPSSPFLEQRFSVVSPSFHTFYTCTNATPGAEEKRQRTRNAAVEGAFLKRKRDSASLATPRLVVCCEFLRMAGDYLHYLTQSLYNASLKYTFTVIKSPRVKVSVQREKILGIKMKGGRGQGKSRGNGSEG